MIKKDRYYKITSKGKTGIPVTVFSKIELLDQNRFKCVAPFARNSHFHEEQAKFIVEYRIDLPTMIFEIDNVSITEMDEYWHDFWMDIPLTEAIRKKQMISGNQPLAEAISKIQKNTLSTPS